MPQHYFHAEGLDFSLLGYVVLASYLLTTGFLLVTIRDGFRTRSYGMPPIGILVMLAVCLIVLVGPFSSQSHLFFPPSNRVLLAMWGLWVVLLAVILGQYVVSAARDSAFARRTDLFLLLTGLQFATVFAGFWTFVKYYQDWYVNEICLIATLVLSLGYFGSLFARRDVRAQSVLGAWLLTLGNALLFGAMVAGNMSDPFPEAAYGYSFIYWLFAVTLLANLGYAVALRARRQETSGGELSAEGFVF